MLCAPKLRACHALLGAALLVASITISLPAQTVRLAQPPATVPVANYPSQHAGSPANAVQPPDPDAAPPGPMTIYVSHWPERSNDTPPSPASAVEPPGPVTIHVSHRLERSNDTPPSPAPAVAPPEPVTTYLAQQPERANDTAPSPASAVEPFDPVTIYLAQQPERADDPEPPIEPIELIEPPETVTPPVLPEGPAVRPTPLRTRPLTGLRLASARPPALRLASVPNMMGDFFSPTMQLDYIGDCNCPVTARATVPLAAGGRRLKMSENNKAFPMDRCYFIFQHFHNVIDTDPDVTAFFTGRSASLNRYVLGFEKTFFQEQCSIDIRLPLAEKYRYADSALAAEGGNVGDFTMIFKALLLATDTCAVAAGLGAGTPTGENADGRIFDTRFSLKNQAFHLSPFVGGLWVPNNQFFVQGFLEVDVPSQGNRFDIENTRTGDFESAGYLNEQTLFKVDVAGGWWIYRSWGERGPCGLAAIAEFHYTTTVQDADVLTFPLGNGTVRFGDLLNRRDVSNVSVGLHTLLRGKTTLRVAAVFPVENRLDNPFDAEVNVSLNCYR